MSKPGARFPTGHTAATASLSPFANLTCRQQPDQTQNPPRAEARQKNGYCSAPAGQHHSRAAQGAWGSRLRTPRSPHSTGPIAHLGGEKPEPVSSERGYCTSPTAKGTHGHLTALCLLICVLISAVLLWLGREEDRGAQGTHCHQAGNGQVWRPARPGRPQRSRAFFTSTFPNRIA